MGRRPLNENKYLKTAKKRNFTVLRIPASCREPTEWRCNVCGRLHKISQNSLEYSKTAGCHCNIALPIERYLEFRPTFVLKDVYPRSTLDKCRWEYNGKIILATYYEVQRKCQRLQKQKK